MLDDSRLNFRKAADTDAHDEAIVANINRIVGEDDELWILGDIGYRTSVRHLKSCLRQLRCRHLHAVIGNHDDWCWTMHPREICSNRLSRTARRS